MKRTFDRTIIVNTENFMGSLDTFKELVDFSKQFPPCISALLVDVPFVYTLTFATKKDKRRTFKLIKKYKKANNLDSFFFDGKKITGEMISALKIFNVDITTWS